MGYNTRIVLIFSLREHRFLFPFPSTKFIRAALKAHTRPIKVFHARGSAAEQFAKSRHTYSNTIYFTSSIHTCVHNQFQGLETRLRSFPLNTLRGGWIKILVRCSRRDTATSESRAQEHRKRNGESINASTCIQKLAVGGRTRRGVL